MKKLTIVLFLVLFAVPAMAETYTWTDDRGTVNFTEDLGKVPKKYRKKVRVIGGDDTEAPPAGIAEDKPAAGVVPKGAAPVPLAKDQEKVLYGGKEGSEWSREFATVGAELRSSEGQLVDTRKRMDDTSGMSRNEYLSLQLTIRNMERRVLELRKRLEELQREAREAEVPPELWQ